MTGLTNAHSQYPHFSVYFSVNTTNNINQQHYHNNDLNWMRQPRLNTNTTNYNYNMTTQQPAPPLSVLFEMFRETKIWMIGLLNWHYLNILQTLWNPLVPSVDEAKFEKSDKNTKFLIFCSVACRPVCSSATAGIWPILCEWWSLNPHEIKTWNTRTTRKHPRTDIAHQFYWPGNSDGKSLTDLTTAES